MEQIKNLWFAGNRIYMRTTNGKVYSRPLKAYMHISSFYETTEPSDQNEVAAILIVSLGWTYLRVATCLAEKWGMKEMKDATFTNAEYIKKENVHVTLE